MIITKENERLYLRTIDFNRSRVLSALAAKVESKGGRVAPMKTALISDRALSGSNPIKVTHLSYIQFILDGIVYYFQTDDNIFFPDMYTKTPLNGNKFSRDAYLMEFETEWKYDCLFSSGCSDDEIRAVADLLFSALVALDCCEIYRDFQRVKVPNYYNNGWHWEQVAKSERFEVVNW